ncbi:MAG: chemotaxis protein CheX [Syntrophaceae bacterium]
MNRILGIDCSPQVNKSVLELLGGKVSIQNDPFQEGMPLDGYQMILFEACGDQEYNIKRIRSLRYACKFRNLPIIIIRGKENHIPLQSYIMAGATEVLTLSESPIACGRILKGYLIPDRKPLPEELEYLTPFVNNTRNVLETMASVNVEFQDVYFSNDIKIFGDVSGIMGLSGNAEGTLVVTFYWSLAKMIVAKMMGVDEDKLDAELIHDGVSEIINMISGSTKREFVGKPYHFEISLPSVVVGSGHQVGHIHDTSIAVLIFRVENQFFSLYVCIKPKNKSI